MKLLLLKIFIDNEKTNIPDQTTDELETDIEVVTIENNVVNDVDESDSDETIQIEDLTTLTQSPDKTEEQLQLVSIFHPS